MNQSAVRADVAGCQKKLEGERGKGKEKGKEKCVLSSCLLFLDDAPAVAAKKKGNPEKKKKRRREGGKSALGVISFTIFSFL